MQRCGPTGTALACRRSDDTRADVMNVCRWAARRTARAANGAVLHQSGSVLPTLLQRGGQLPRPLHSGSASDLRTPLLHDGAVWPVPVLSKREASALREQLLAETSGVLQAGFLGSDLLYYKAHLIFSVVDTLARHPAVVSAVQRALGSEDVLLWDASIPLKPPTSSDAGADENASTFFPWHQVILLRNHLSRSVENGGIDSHAGGADLAVQ